MGGFIELGCPATNSFTQRLATHDCGSALTQRAAVFRIRSGPLDRRLITPLVVSLNFHSLPRWLAAAGCLTLIRVAKQKRHELLQ